MLPPHLRSLGKFELLARIGQGAMGEVYRAKDNVLDREVAIKMILAGDEERRARFRREAQSAARLNHPNIVVVYEFGEEQGRFFMAMELLPGSDLRRVVGRVGAGDIDEQLRMMEEMADGVAFAHSCDVIHRDLKPANIHLLPNGRIKIVDFGLARIGKSSMTRSGTVLGTPNYMAPEQIRGDAPVDARADVFSLGSVFYELLSGRKAFNGESVHTVLYQVLSTEPPPLSEVAPAVPEGIARIVSLAMKKDPEKRFRTMAELRDAIRAERGRAAEFRSIEGLDAVLGEPSSPGSKPSSATLRMDGPSASPGITTGSRSLPPPRPDTDRPVATFLDEGSRIVHVVVERDDETLLDAALRSGIPHVHACGGQARCTTCRVKVSTGGAHLRPRTAEEAKLARRLGWDDSMRLACQTKVTGDVSLRRLVDDEETRRVVASSDSIAIKPGKELPVALLAARIRDFGIFSKKALPYDVTHVLNRFFAQIADPAYSNDGEIDRYVGAGFLAVFGLDGKDARSRCSDAVRAALRMRRRMEDLNRYLVQHFQVELTLDLALHHARVVSGELGHPRLRRRTIVGDAIDVVEDAVDVVAECSSGIVATEELINVVEDRLELGGSLPRSLGTSGREFTVFELVDFDKPDTVFLVQSSFDLVAPRAQEASRLFYDRLFELAPDVRPLFADVDMEIQGRMLMEMLAAAVKGLDRLDELRPILEDLGRRHSAYGVRIDHYAAVEEALFFTLSTALGDKFDLDVRLAWTRIYNFIAQVMIESQLGTAAAA